MRYGVHNVYGSLYDVTLTFDLLTSKPNQHIYEPKYIYDKNWVTLPSLVFEILCSRGFKDVQTHILNGAGGIKIKMVLFVKHGS